MTNAYKMSQNAPTHLHVNNTHVELWSWNIHSQLDSKTDISELNRFKNLYISYC